jgi:CRP-like cAMP-binding protein
MDPMRNHHMTYKNQLLSVLPEAVRQRWSDQLELVEMPLGKVLYESSAKMDYVYFPEDCIVSLLFVLFDGSSTEIAVVGHEGLVGISIFMGGDTTPNRAVVQSAGHSFRVPSKFLKDEFHHSIEVMHLFLRFTQALVTQMTQTAVCNRHHTLDQQLCRWLLLSMDRLAGPELVMTQELIANMLGVRREGVTVAAGKLQSVGIISYARGHIKVIDRPALEARSCECYALVKNEYDRLLPDQIAS